MTISQELFFGQVALKKEFITLPQLDECLRIQKRMRAHRKIGDVLIDKGYITTSQRDDVVAILERHKRKAEVPNIDDATLEKHILIKGIASQKHLKDAKRIQKAMMQKGKEMSLAEVMLAKRYITITQLKRARPEGEVRDIMPEVDGYEIIKKIRKGGMGTVYKARQLSMDRVIALKILAPELTDDETYVKRFITEAKAVAKLNHENIVSGYDAGQSNGYYFFNMEYINGETILEIMRREKKLLVPFALKITYQTTKALEHAAKHNIIHRDIKPGNIMINHQGVIKLCDLGFAKTSNIDLLTKKGTTLGTPYYMSPEQCRGLDNIDCRSDIYSLGATLYHMLVGRVPFSGKTASEILKKHLIEELVIPHDVRATISEQVCHVIEKMMAKKAENRYLNPRELLNELEPVMARFQAPNILIVYPARCFPANDLALLIAEGAYIEGIKIELVSGEDLTADHLIQAGAVVIGSTNTEGRMTPDIRGALEIMTRFPNDMKGKVGATFIAHDPDAEPQYAIQQIHTITRVMLDLGMMVRASFEGVLAGQKTLDDPEGEEGQSCKELGHDIAISLLNLTAGKQTMFPEYTS